MYECTNVRMYECTNARMYECTNVTGIYPEGSPAPPDPPFVSDFGDTTGTVPNVFRKFYWPKRSGSVRQARTKQKKKSLRDLFCLLVFYGCLTWNGVI